MSISMATRRRSLIEDVGNLRTEPERDRFCPFSQMSAYPKISLRNNVSSRSRPVCIGSFSLMLVGCVFVDAIGCDVKWLSRLELIRSVGSWKVMLVLRRKSFDFGMTHSA